MLYRNETSFFLYFAFKFRIPPYIHSCNVFKFVKTVRTPDSEKVTSGVSSELLHVVTSRNLVPIYAVHNLPKDL